MSLAIVGGGQLNKCVRQVSDTPVRFEDFVIELDAGSGGEFRARVLKSPFGEGAVRFSIPVAFETGPPFHGGGLETSRDLYEARTTAPPADPQPLDFGTELFHSVFQGQVRTLLDKSRGQLEVSPNLGLRLKIKLDLDNEETGTLADLPWELLYDDETEDFFALSRQMSLVRYLDVPRPAQPIPFTPPLRILAVGASPEGLQKLDLQRESRRIAELSRTCPGVEVQVLLNASIGAVREALSGNNFNILHFMGHGIFDAVTGEGLLAFEKPDGSADLVSGRTFATKLRDLRSLGVVTLNACDTARAGHQRGGNPFRGVASALVLGGVPAVVAMQQPISDAAAVSFGSTFYRHLARGALVDEALTEGRQAIHSIRPQSFEWVTPVLFLRIPEGKVFVAIPTERRPEALPVASATSATAALGYTQALRIAAGLGRGGLALVILYNSLYPATPQLSHPGTYETLNIYNDLQFSENHSADSEPSEIWRAVNDLQPEPAADSVPGPDRRSIRTHPTSRLLTQARPISLVRYVTQGTLPTEAVTISTPTQLTEPPSALLYHPTLREGGGSPIQNSAAEAVTMAADLPGLSLEAVPPIPYQIVSCTWIAYFQDVKGRRTPVRDTNTKDDRDWLSVRFNESQSPRIRLGVLKVIDKSAEAEESEWNQKVKVAISAIQEMLTVALYSTKRFDVIEQKRIQEVMTQQKNRNAVEPSPTSVMNIGKVLGAQYLVYGTVDEWSPEQGSASGAAKMFSSGKKEAEIAITFALTDVSTGQILYTTTERARMGELSFGLDGFGGTGDTIQLDPSSYVIRACVNKAVFKIATFLRDRRWKGSVVDIKGSEIYINAGSQQGIAPQTRLSLLAVKGLVKDGESGTILGEDLRSIGTLEIIAVQPGFSIARIVEGGKGVKAGDRVEVAAEQVMPPAIPECVEFDDK